MSKHHLLRFITLALSVLVLGLSASVYGVSKNPPITAEEITSHVRHLASDELGGRESGTPGNREAADYIASHLNSYGLKPLGDNGTYFQNFTFTSGVRLGDQNSLAISMGENEKELKVKKDYVPLSFSSEGTVSGELVFAGYGISAPDLNYDDYADIDVKDKIVLVLRYIPEDYSSKSKFYRYAPLHYKATNAREKGAKGIIFVTPFSQKEEEDLGGMRFHSSFSDSRIHAVILRREIANKILKTAGREMKDLEKKLSDKKTDSFIVPDTGVSLHTDLIKEERSTSNIIGLLEGSDPELKDEVIVIGAHYDHIGLGDEFSVGKDESNKGKVHNGADDNASGTAGLLELAEYFSHKRDSLERSLIFIAFSGEEKGVLGSSYYVKNPKFPLEKTVAMLNMDMIGRLRDNTLTVIGAGTSPQWKDLIESASSAVGLSIKTRESGLAASDQTVFFTKDIPVLLFFTGVHSDYHTPGDDWNKINSEGEEKILRLIAEITRNLNQTPQRIAFSKPKVDEKEGGMGAARFDVYLGTVPDYSEEVDGVKLMGVQSGSPAEKAGLREGDIIVNLAGKTVKGIHDYVYALGETEAGVPTDMVVIRNGKPVKLNIVPESRKRSVH
ncbi:MAG TPA: M20/M25/M40 family metallo-hydrolase [Thermodesulfobacteriota bacterium]|nr:M20/M25/M40 family metallo-hydrolase [Thermodesulfobacteriota bacterium]